MLEYQKAEKEDKQMVEDCKRRLGAAVRIALNDSFKTRLLIINYRSGKATIWS